MRGTQTILIKRDMIGWIKDLAWGVLTDKVRDQFHSTYSINLHKPVKNDL